MLSQWAASRETGMMTFAWSWGGNSLSSKPDLLSVLQSFNQGASPTPPSPPADTTPPSTPANFAVTAKTGSSISVSWSASTDNVAVSGYSLSRNGTFVATVPALGYTFTGLSCGLTYALTVEAFDAAGNHSTPASLSAATSACTDTTPPTTPTMLRATNTTPTSIAVAWNASTDNVGVAGYGVYRDGSLLTSIGPTPTSYSYTGLTCGKSYTLAVDAYDAAGNRSLKATIAASTSACPTDTTPPSTPTGLTRTSSTQTSVSLSWNASSDNVGVTGYSIYRGGTLDGTSGSTSYTSSGLACGSSYSFAVEARDAAGNVSARSSSVTATTAACPSGGDAVITAAGDICASPTDCAPTASLLDQINPNAALTLGDNAYVDGSLSEYRSYYQPNWGRHDFHIYPSPGNHEFHIANAQGYRDYFGSRAPALWYSYDVGAWHLISLPGDVGVSAGAGSPQETWLRQDLAAHANRCILAYWHEPMFSSGTVHGSDSTFGAIWNDLYNAKADIVLNGHEHNYERFAKQNPSGATDPNGIREFVVGTGGASHGYPFGTPLANSQVRNDSTWGVLKLTLHASSYDWQFVPIAGSTFTDSGSDTCS
jgi:chitodextrinase